VADSTAEPRRLRLDQDLVTPFAKQITIALRKLLHHRDERVGLMGQAEQSCNRRPVQDEDRRAQDSITGNDEAITPIDCESLEIEGTRVRWTGIGRLLVPKPKRPLRVPVFCGVIPLPTLDNLN